MKIHRRVPFLRRLYAQRDEARRQREEDSRIAANELRAKNETIAELRSRLEDTSVAFSAMNLPHSISEPKTVSHATWVPYLTGRFNKPGVRILEVGSRNVTGGANRGWWANADYTGFDIYPGENVDVAGDAHKLSSYFPAGSFDFIFSSAVFEHLHMPWVVAEEITKLLKIGGHVFVETHFSFAAHERPWNFFQFSDMGLRALFNSALGFELVDSGMSNKLNGVFSQEAIPPLRGMTVPELYCHSEILCRKTRGVDDFHWSDARIDDIVDGTRYPSPFAVGRGDG